MSFEHFDQSRIFELWQTGIVLGLADPAKRSLLLAHVNQQLAGKLVLMPDPHSQLLADLNALNGILRLATGEVPIERYLKVAVALTNIREEAKVLRSALDEVSARMSGQPALPNPARLPEYKETIIFQDDMVPYTFLAGGHEAGNAVAKLFVCRFDQGNKALSNGRPVIFNGTGWLLSNNLLITNHHVINGRYPYEAPADVNDLTAQAKSTIAQFDYNGENLEGTKVATESLLAWDSTLDYAILRLAEPLKREPLRLAAEALVKPGDEYIPVNIIQHPEGNPKKVALRNNLVSHSTETELRYFTDSKVGSSGSPVFDDQWRVVALHRGSTAAENVKFQGRTTAWINMGTQISSIRKHIQTNYPEVWQQIQTANN